MEDEGVRRCELGHGDDGAGRRNHSAVVVHVGTVEHEVDFRSTVGASLAVRAKR